MEKTIELLGYLILTFLGFVVPVVGLLLSIFGEGVLRLTKQYENEKSQKEKSILEQVEKQREAKSIDIAEIERNIETLKAIKKSAESKLSYLNPQKQLLRLFGLLMISFLGVSTSFMVYPNLYRNSLITLSLFSFGYATIVLWKLFGIIIEVRKTIDSDRKETEGRAIELLSALVEKTEKGMQYFLKKVFIVVDSKIVDQDEKVSVVMSDNKKQNLAISIFNRENRMVKNIQIGLVFPPDFIIHKTDSYRVTTGETAQVVRYDLSLIHADTNRILSPLVATPLKKGPYKINTFIKAENIEATYRNFTLKVE